MSLTIKELLELQREFDESHAGAIPFFKEIGKENLTDLEHLIVCLLGELGEFANIVKKIRRGDFELEAKKEDLDEELVDIFIYLLKIAGQFNVDLETGYRKKLQKNVGRFEKFKK